VPQYEVTTGCYVSVGSGLKFKRPGQVVTLDDDEAVDYLETGYVVPLDRAVYTDYIESVVLSESVPSESIEEPVIKVPVEESKSRSRRKKPEPEPEPEPEPVEEVSPDAGDTDAGDE